MKIKNIITAMTLFCCASIYAQVGIGTQNPQGIFNMDGVTGTYRTISQDGASGGHVAWMHTSNSDGTNNLSYRWQFSGSDATGFASQGGGGTGNSMAVRCIQN
jgi:hypothetical protein